MWQDINTVHTNRPGLPDVTINRLSNIMIKLLVIADDLTGATDTGVQFAKQGIATFVTFDMDVDIKTLSADLQVLVIDTESRHLPPDKAAGRVKKVINSARKQGVAFFYKKTDSTLRGNVGAELDAALESSGSKKLAFIPAFPKAGRYTIKGSQYIGNKLLHLTQFGSDPLEPAICSFIPEILGSQTRRGVALASPEGIINHSDNYSEKAEIILFDCRNDTEMRVAGESLCARNLLKMTAGSAGFAEVLPGLLKLPRTTQKFSQPAGPALIINGSLNEASLRQTAHAEKKGIKAFVLPQELLSGSSHKTEKIKSLRNDLSFEASGGNSVILRGVKSRKQLEEILPTNDRNANVNDIYGLASQRLGEIVAKILREVAFSSIVVFGGDTLIAILKAMEVTGIRPLEEISPGLAVSQLTGTPHSLALISKAGGFGDEDVILNIINYIRGGNR